MVRSGRCGRAALSGVSPSEALRAQYHNPVVRRQHGALNIRPSSCMDYCREQAISNLNRNRSAQPGLPSTWRFHERYSSRGGGECETIQK